MEEIDNNVVQFETTAQREQRERDEKQVVKNDLQEFMLRLLNAETPAFEGINVALEWIAKNHAEKFDQFFEENWNNGNRGQLLQWLELAKEQTDELNAPDFIQAWVGFLYPPIKPEAPRKVA